MRPLRRHPQRLLQRAKLGPVGKELTGSPCRSLSAEVVVTLSLFSGCSQVHPPEVVKAEDGRRRPVDQGVGDHDGHLAVRVSEEKGFELS